MAHLLEPASSGRARCRGCARPIELGALRFGERLPNPFAEGDTTIWFHPACAAFKRPEPLLEVLAETQAVPEREELERIARDSLSYRRLQRIDGAERARSSQAHCRSCHERIERGTWRIRLVFHEDGRFSPGGFLHLACRRAYFERDDVLERVLHFSPDLPEPERAALEQACSADAGPRGETPPA